MPHIFYLKKPLVYIVLLLTTSWTLVYLWYYNTNNSTQQQVLIRASTWQCKGSGRHQICEFTNFCIDSSTGPFIISAKEPPSINVINTEQEDDQWFQPKHVRGPIYGTPRNETLFVYGLFSPYHFSHFLYNGLIPLYSTMLEYNATSADFTLRASTVDTHHTALDVLLPTTTTDKKDIVLKRADQLTPQQTAPSSQPTCFARAVVGTGNRCSLPYCESQIPAHHYASFKSWVLKEHPEITEGNLCADAVVEYTSTGRYKLGILNRKRSRRITNVPELIDRLVSYKDTNGEDMFAVRTLDFEEGCDLVNTAHVVKDLDILIAPFGNGLGAGLFMKDDAVVISISARYYSEPWFKYTSTAVGRRFFNFECESASCQVVDETLADYVLGLYGIHLNQTEMRRFLASSYPEEVLQAHLPEKPWEPFWLYHKDVARRVDVDRFMPYLKAIIDNKPNADVPFPKTCEKPNVCCDLQCEAPLERNVFGETNAWQYR